MMTDEGSLTVRVNPERRQVSGPPAWGVEGETHTGVIRGGKKKKENLHTGKQVPYEEMLKLPHTG